MYRWVHPNLCTVHSSFHRSSLEEIHPLTLSSQNNYYFLQILCNVLTSHKGFKRSGLACVIHFFTPFRPMKSVRKEELPQNLCPEQPWVRIPDTHPVKYLIMC